MIYYSIYLEDYLYSVSVLTYKSVQKYGRRGRMLLNWRKKMFQDLTCACNLYILPFATIYLFFEECRSRSACKYVKSRAQFHPFPNKPWFLRVCSTSLLKTQWEKEKLLIMSNFSFSHSVFYPFGWTYCHFHQI